MGPFIDPSRVLAMLLMLLSGGVRDLAGLVSTDSYWHAKNVTVSIEQLTHELDEIKPADVSKLIADLDADDPRTRDDATAKIAGYGPAAIPALTDAAKNGSPEVVTRANALLAKIHAAAKVGSVRRLMAIRTLGEKKDPAALTVLRTLLDSREMFEADYAKTAIAKIEGKVYAPTVASEAERAADVGLLPSRLDVVAQLSPELDGVLPIEKLLAQLPTSDEQKAKSIAEANSQILRVLETVGNIRLNCVTWGFYAAPPGQPGNTVAIARGSFDPATLYAAIAQVLPNPKKVEGIDVFQIDEDSAIFLPGDGRVIFLGREGGGELGLEAMAAALKKGAGDFSANPDLPGLVKSVDTKSPLWAVTKMASGLKEIAGPLGEFDTATLVATQSLDKEKVVSDIKLAATTPDPTKAKQAVDDVTRDLQLAVEEGRKEEQKTPYIKPMVDFAAGIKLQSDGGKATLTGSLVDMPMVPVIIMSRQEMGLPNVVPQR